jgi:hypothetical protein
MIHHGQRSNDSRGSDEVALKATKLQVVVVDEGMKATTGSALERCHFHLELKGSKQEMRLRVKYQKMGVSNKGLIA